MVSGTLTRVPGGRRDPATRTSRVPPVTSPVLVPPAASAFSRRCTSSPVSSTSSARSSARHRTIVRRVSAFFQDRSSVGFRNRSFNSSGSEMLSYRTCVIASLAFAKTRCRAFRAFAAGFAASAPSPVPGASSPAALSACASRSFCRRSCAAFRAAARNSAS